ASLSIAIPSRVRSVGFSIGALFVLPGFLVLPTVGAVGDAVGFRYGLLILVPIFVIGGLIVASAGGLIERDVRDVWTSMHTRTQMLLDRHAGRLPLLAVRELAVGHDAASCWPTWPSRAPRVRSSPSSARTAPGSPHCCGPSAGWWRPITAPSC